MTKPDYIDRLIRAREEHLALEAEELSYRRHGHDEQAPVILADFLELDDILYRLEKRRTTRDHLQRQIQLLESSERLGLTEEARAVRLTYLRSVLHHLILHAFADWKA